MPERLHAEPLYIPAQGMNVDSNGVSAKTMEAADILNCNFTTADVTQRGGTRYLGESDTETSPTEDILELHEYTHPTLGKMLFGFGSSTIFRYQNGVGWSPIFTGTPFTGIEQWSITNYVDRDIGATIAAAGSIYTRPNESYLDGNQRVLIYFDPVAIEFKDLQMNTELYQDEETGPLSLLAAPYIHTGTLSNVPIISGQTYFVVENGATDPVGVVAVAGEKIYEDEVTGARTNRLIPVDESQVIYGDNSWVNIDDGTFSIEFTTPDWHGYKCRAYYTQKKAVSYRPLYLANFFGCLIMANTCEYINGAWKYTPWRVRHTIPQHIDFAYAGDYQELVLDDISPILGVKSLETAASSTLVGPLYFYKHNSIIRGVYNQNFRLNPQAPVPLLSFEIAYSEGIEATRSIVSVEGKHFFLGRNDVYAFNGYERVSLTHDNQTGNTRVQRYLFDNIDLRYMQNCFGVYDDIGRKYYLYIKLLDDIEAFPQTALVYDIDLNAWSRVRGPQTSCAVSIDLVPGGTISGLPGNINELLEGDTNVEIQNLVGQLRKLFVVAQKDNQELSTTDVYYTDRTDGFDMVGNTPDIKQEFESYFITRDFLGDSLEEQDRVQRMYMECQNGSMKVSYNSGYSLDPADFIAKQTLTYSTSTRREVYNPDVTAIHTRFLVELGQSSIFRWLQVFSKRQEFTNE